MTLQDELFCGDKGELGATCFYDLSDRKETYSKTEWDQMRFGWICSSPDTFSRRQAALVKFCEDTGRCTKEEMDAIKEYEAKLKSIQD